MTPDKTKLRERWVQVLELSSKLFIPNDLTQEPQKTSRNITLEHRNTFFFYVSVKFNCIQLTTVISDVRWIILTWDLLLKSTSVFSPFWRVWPPGHRPAWYGGCCVSNSRGTGGCCSADLETESCGVAQPAAQWLSVADAKGTIRGSESLASCEGVGGDGKWRWMSPGMRMVGRRWIWKRSGRGILESNQVPKSSWWFKFW